MTKLVAFDLDGTLTQHKSPLSDEARSALDALGRTRRLLMVGAGNCRRIFAQMGNYPIDILGNYGLQYAEYDPAARDIRFVFDKRLPCDRESVLRRASAFRAAHGFNEFAGDSVEFHDSGVVTIALLGTKAALADKLAFDPDRSRRRAVYDEVKALFPDYKVFVGGSSSFDMAPAPYDKGFNTTGLWSRSRHPNYFAEQAIWLCFYVFSIGAGIGLFNWSIIGALLLVVLFLGSSALAEEISSGKYPQYENYVKSVSRFFPLTK